MYWIVFALIFFIVLVLSVIAIIGYATSASYHYKKRSYYCIPVIILSLALTTFGFFKFEKAVENYAITAHECGLTEKTETFKDGYSVSVKYRVVRVDYD